MYARVSKSLIRTLALAFVALMPVALAAQDSAKLAAKATAEDSASKWDIFLGYSYLAPHGTVTWVGTGDGKHTNTFTAINYGSIYSAARYFDKYVGAQLEVDEHIVNEYPSGIVSGSTSSYDDFSGGSVGLIFRFPSANVTPFAHALAGVEYAGGVWQPDTFGPVLTIGGGMDFNTPLLDHRLAIRVFQADFQYAHEDFAPYGRANFNMPRLSAGLVYHIGSFAPPPPVIEKQEELKTRGPIITFMGHVDHGKTSLMDAIRKTRVAASEAGGITQHIGAYTVDYKGSRITFLDTPGHAAFTAMRARGAHVTDIVVLVVAADDGLMPQTLEAISHAKAAPHVKIMVAINKIDLPSANVDRVKKQLQEKDLSPEEWSGDTVVCEVSATKGTGIDHLLEMMALQAEVMELKASPTATPRGTVIEAQVEPGRGPTATVIVQMGTLKTGDPFICGDYGGKIKSLMDDRGKPIKEAGPSTPVKVLGFSGLPQAGDEFLVMESERSAKTLSEERLVERRTDKLSVPQRATLESLLEAADGKKHLRIVLKCDAQGSLEALTGALDQIESKKIDLAIVHAGVGPISESDILLASASNAVVVGFNVKVESMAVNVAKREGVQVKLYSIIYELIDQMKEAMAGLLDPEHRETVIGHAEVKQIFKLSRGIVAGCLVTDGRIARTARARVLRRRQPVYDGGLSTLRRFQDDVKEVRVGLECGIKLGDFNEYQVGDIIECYQLEAVAQKL